jgi:hypothetical protein
LFIGDTKVDKNMEIPKGIDIIHGGESVDSSEATISTFSEGFFLEIYDETSNRWLIWCPFNNKVYTNTQDVKKYFKNK